MQLNMNPTLLAAAAAGAIALCLSGCSKESHANSSSLSGAVAIDGSSTVYPITEAVAEEFRKVHPEVRVTVGVSGTGGGFKKFCVGETAINDASRPIKSKEQDTATKNGVEYIELPIAYDGLTVVTNKDNDFVDHLTVSELKKIWKPGSNIKNWSQVREGFPDLKLTLYGPGTDSGTFDYFTEAINGKGGACRADFTASEDDNVLVKGVAGEKGALGFFGFAYYAENTEILRAVPIAPDGEKPVGPTLETINDGSYRPLSRPIFIYVSGKHAARPELAAFVEFYLANAPKLAQEVGYVKLPAAIYEAAQKRFTERVTGSLFAAEGASKKTLEELYR